MTERIDAYWDDLGIAWCAINPQVHVIAPRLKARLRRQSFVITAGLIAAMSLGVAGVLLGLYTSLGGWSTGTWNLVTRGIAIVAISVILLVGALLQLPVRAGAAGALDEMINLSIVRAQRILVLIRMGFLACAVAVVFGLAGSEIRTHFGSAPKLSPIVDILLILAFALGLYFWRRQVKGHMERMYALGRALEIGSGKQAGRQQ